jgi:hypothetical protein
MGEAENLAQQRAPAGRIHWPRVRVYGWAILLGLALWALGGVYSLRFDPKRFVNQALAQLPFPASVGQVGWTGSNTLTLRYVKLGDFFYADQIVVYASVHDLMRRHVTSLKVFGADLFMTRFNQMLARTKKSAGMGIDWTISELVVGRGLVMLDFGPSLPSMPVDVGTKHLVILRHLHLGTPDRSAPMVKERQLELENIHFTSPFDPLAPVLALPLVRVTFTYDELWHHRIRGIDLVRPDLYLGQDLFWFTDEIRKARAREVKTGPESPWEIGQFAVEYGRLSVNTFGQPRFTFPFFFDTRVDEIRLDQLDKISAKSVIAIRHFTKDYPEYKLKVVDLHGRLEFSVPPTNAKANNVVPTVQIKEISWNDIPVTDAWASATFDPTGIYARVGGNCEKGLMNGNAEVYYTKGFEWNANFFAHRIDCAPIAERLAGKYGSLTGTLDGKIAVDGKGTTIQKCNGTLTLDRPGVLKVPSADRLLNDLPPKTTALKRDALKILLQAFSYYPYHSGSFKVNYTAASGSAKLKLDSPAGARDFEVYWHPFGGSEVAKDAESH